ncbi:DUF4397 domain-containing protein [Hymenobacter sp. GOD-10R]|uniref:DUF4397 domain-containing protein n=1 Tax=Hymenobacter sp. GOD-10R TaxID=3093922 RepID=UPI002D77FA75|nr:DUF4397 domain-containing protein [Hymenobacter sp. GOD-10R]WRQ27485.1 DUF4397 domain-containing protein [Hymenobacter sp. GOD-10R]
MAFASYFRPLLKLCVVATLLTSCKKDSVAPTPAPQPVPPTTQPLGPHGFIRVVNGLAMEPTMYQLRNDSVQLSMKTKNYGRSLGAGSTSQYYPVEVGATMAEVNLKPASTSAYQWMSINMTIEESKRYSLLVFNSGGFTQTKLVREEALPTPVAGKAHLRLINIASGYSPVHIEETGGDFRTDLDWGQTQAYVPVAARTYNLSTVRSNATITQQFTQSLTLAAGKAYTLVLRGDFQPEHPREQAAFMLVEDE